MGHRRRTLAESIAQRDQSSSPFLPSWSRTTRCSFAQTLAVDQSVKRRWTVCQEAPKTGGTCRQVQPDVATKMIAPVGVGHDGLLQGQAAADGSEGEQFTGQRGPLTGPNPTDRGKLGSKMHVVCDRNGLPISVGISGANLHDSQALVPLMRGIPPIRSRFGPRRRRPAKLHADKGYDFDHLRGWLRRRQIVPRIARRGIEPSDRLGRHRWVVERTMSWLNGCRRLHRRYERKAEHFLAFVGIASTLICFRRLIR